MNAYSPADWHTLLPVAAMCGGLLALGLLVRRFKFAPVAWLAGLPAVAATHWLLRLEPPGVRMLALIPVLLLWMKAVVTATSPEKPAATRWLLWATLWPGMRPASASPERRMARVRDARLLVRGLACIACGLALILAAHGVWRWFDSAWPATLPLLVGISLCLHFGLFGLLAWAWRSKALFRNPLLSGSLREFWGRRWNLAFSEMMQESIQRPLRQRPRTATAAIFLFSGLLHEVAISLPVQAGWGLPMLYFALNGAATMLEPRVITPGSKVARVWTAFWVLAPLPLLFHPWFIQGAVWPIAGIAP